MFARKAAAALLVGSMLALPVVHAEDGIKTEFGETVALGNGAMRTYVSYLEEAGARRPTALGVEISATAVNSLPEAAPVMAIMPVPAAASLTPVKFAMVDWNPMGHIPPGVYDLPHFDFHFYLTDPSSLDAIKPGECPGKGEGVACETFERATAGVPRALVPPGFISVGAVVPMMGDHLIDVQGPEFTGTTFTHTFIYGAFDGEITFYEPMVTTKFLMTQPENACAQIAQPQGMERDGWYPTRYCMRYSAANRVYTVSIEDFVMHRDRGMLVAGLYKTELCRDAETATVAAALESGMNLFNLRAGIWATEEGQRVAGVRGLYQELLGRDPNTGGDCAGMRSWVASPLTLDQIRQAIMESEEYKAKGDKM